ncbi:MAG: murein peptide amidase A [Magnetococcales bacterium]|nr:murein peptide amidase A [Magnetococcales bacterium]
MRTALLLAGLALILASGPVQVHADYPLPRFTAQETCQKIGNKLGSVSVKSCLAQALRFVEGVSVRGLPILEKEYPPLPTRQPQARVLLLGGIHGDEYSSVSIMFRWMQILDQYHSGLFHWKVVPVVNPDGLLRPKSHRMNHRGVDLNRNFPTPNWKKDSRDYWVRRTGRDPRRFPGPSALSEPESRWISQLIDEFQPHVIVSVHAPYGLLDFDGGPQKPPDKLGNLYLSLLGTYPGSLGRYAGTEKKIPVITIELPYAGIMPTSKEISKIWVDLVRWLSKNTRANDTLVEPTNKSVAQAETSTEPIP